MKKFVIFLLIFIFTVSFAFAEDTIMKFFTIPQYNEPTVQFRDENLELINTYVAGPEAQSDTATLSPDGKYVYIGHRGLNTISVIETDTVAKNVTITAKATIDLYGIINRPTGIVFDASNNSLIIGSCQDGLHIVKLKDNLYEIDESVPVKKIFSGPIWNCALNEQYIYSTANGGSLFLYMIKFQGKVGQLIWLK